MPINLNFEKLQALAKAIAPATSGSHLTHCFSQCSYKENSSETKWTRIFNFFVRTNNAFHNDSNILKFIEMVFAPVLFIGRTEEFERYRGEVNKVLSFHGMEITQQGKCIESKKVETLDEAEKRAREMRSVLQGRNVHPELLKYCRAELLQENYFHAVFEAVKGLMQLIRDKANLTEDGAELIQKAFSLKDPYIVFNTLTTQSERSEHTGFLNLLLGCHLAARNPRAHTPRALWNNEEDAIDYMTLINMLYKKLKNSHPVTTRNTP